MQSLKDTVMCSELIPSSVYEYFLSLACYMIKMVTFGISDFLVSLATDIYLLFRWMIDLSYFLSFVSVFLTINLSIANSKRVNDQANLNYSIRMLIEGEDQIERSR